MSNPTDPDHAGFPAIPGGTGRRDFVRIAAGTLAAPLLAGCGAAAPRAAVLAAPTPVPAVESDADVERLLPTLRNWGRWGADDVRGTLNYLTPQLRRRAAASVVSGRTVSLSRESALADGVERGAHEVTLRPMGSRDYIAMVFHGFRMTHLDALAHSFADEQRMYNGRPRGEVTAAGAGPLGVDAMAARGVAGRGVLLDVGAMSGGALEPGTAVRVADLERAEREQRVRVGTGDLLFVRTGAGERNTRERRAGLHPECLAWLHARQVALLGGDGDNDVSPLAGFDRWGSAMHSVAIPYMGMPLVDNAELNELASACRDEGRWSFFLTIAPLRIRGATGSPINPIAVL